MLPYIAYMDSMGYDMIVIYHYISLYYYYISLNITRLVIPSRL